MKPIVIIGLGNFLMGDEGVGIHATKLLREKELPASVDIIDAGVPSLALLHMLEGRSMAIIIDCADFGGKPGEITTFTLNQIKRPRAEPQASLHAADLLTTFDIAAQTGLPLPKIRIIGIQPRRVDMTMELSNEAKDALEKIEAVVRSIVEREDEDHSSLH